jgi:glycine/D-amino acid oxidase-like deaminating enzyme
MTENFPTQAEVVIIGGGVIGIACAFQLSEMGVTEVVLLERDRLGCGTSWHAAGNIPLMDHTSDIVYLNQLAANLYEFFDSEQPIGWRRCGRVILARTDSRLVEFKALIETAKEVGVEAHLISPQDIQEKLPLFRTDDLVGALWSPDDGRVNPTDLIAAYASKARANGVHIREQITANNISICHGEVCAVETSEGTIQCETVVNCAGLWSRPLGLCNKINIPVYPVEHFYMVSESITGITPDMPTFRDPDSLIYGREEVGGLLLGCFDQQAKPISPSMLPAEFSFSLLNEDWDQFQPYMERGLHLIPALANAGIKMLLNGPESFTPDSFPILDEVAGVNGYFVLAGMSSAGILRSAGMAMLLAEWICNGKPSMDVGRFSLDRFQPEHNDEAWLRERVRHVPSGHFSVHVGES